MNTTYELIELSSEVYVTSEMRKFNCENALEEKLIKKFLKDSNKGVTKIYLLKSPELYVGFVALSVSRLNNDPVVLIDYLYIQTIFRKKTINELGDIKPSEYLVKFAISCALEVKKIVAVRFVLLQAAHDKLIDFYEKSGFKKLEGTKDAWMIFRLSKDQ
ncbi:hypothetical protein [Thioflexithrix psekupsensis]|uniref:N-acetyltransferase domain-containing protein n=1 Tax=Thioflexithrix psekupsensis TaxID=1570016 RepID=A0A251XCI7_9GAMM|nr:hypothetical protein [Thioflexithrix psekupsensis]OUD16308.1 hypothetical protein TPSD3_00885 [Thioflexithrix psekupsensis]